ncbi:MAG: transaldolase family protein [Nanoarchaeota archaeon]
MALFLDTGNIETIKKYLRMGLLKGVTTNPTILLKEGVTGGMEGVKRKSVEIAQLIYPYPLSIEITNNGSKEEMINEAIELSKLGDNINIKIPFHGPNGEMDNIEVIHELETKHDIRVNATAMMSVQQCFLAAMAGATYVSLFCGRINNMGYDTIKELSNLRMLIDEYKLKAKIICASTREVINVTDWLSAGGHIVTVIPKFVDGMIVHPYTKETVKMFLDDAEKIKNQL